MIRPKEETRRALTREDALKMLKPIRTGLQDTDPENQSILTGVAVRMTASDDCTGPKYTVARMLERRLQQRLATAPNSIHEFLPTDSGYDQFSTPILNWVALIKNSTCQAGIATRMGSSRRLYLRCHLEGLDSINEQVLGQLYRNK
jgi:hypothetical protein